MCVRDRVSDLVREQTHLARSVASLKNEKKNEKRQQEMMQQLANQIREYSGRVSPVAELARSMGYSVDYFSRIFTQIIGQGPQEFVITARISRAKQLLSETSLSIGEISVVLGFRDVFFFSKQFRQKTGHTPTEFRAKLMR
ncbi:MAG: helix-turn-helix transcriptional regulator [Anaerolineae bacterium]|nr:helix-turn-helix transcriptional regulator [Anaerolineae bacterium]